MSASMMTAPSTDKWQELRKAERVRKDRGDQRMGKGVHTVWLPAHLQKAAHSRHSALSVSKNAHHFVTFAPDQG